MAHLDSIHITWKLLEAEMVLEDKMCLVCPILTMDFHGTVEANKGDHG